MVITMSTPVKTSLKMFWTLWESSLSRLRPSRGTETLFTLCSTHQSLMCFLFVIQLKKKILPSSSCVTVHSPGLYIHQVFCFVVSLSPPHICLWMSLQYLHHMYNLHSHNVPKVRNFPALLPPASTASSLSWTWDPRSTAVWARDLLGGSEAVHADKWYHVSPFPAKRTQCEVLEGFRPPGFIPLPTEFLSLTHSVGWGIGFGSLSAVTCWENF